MAIPTRYAGQSHEPLSSPPLVLLEQHTAKLCQRVRADIIECPEDALTVFDGECDDLAFERERVLKKRTGRLVHERDELAYVLVREPQTGEIHGGAGKLAPS